MQNIFQIAIVLSIFFYSLLRFTSRVAFGLEHIRLSCIAYSNGIDLGMKNTGGYS